MKLSNVMIAILSIVISAYTLIGLAERMGWAKSRKNQGWQDFQLRPIGDNKFLLRRLEQSDHAVVVELQEERKNARTVRFVGSDFLSSAVTGSGAKADLGGADFCDQCRTLAVRPGTALGR
jgi:hypothetical protein